MYKLFSPAVRLMNQLKYPQKFLLTSLAFLLLIVGLLYLLILNISKEINFTQKELIGIKYIKPVMLLIIDVQQHRGLTYGYLNGATGLKSRILEKEKQISNIFKEIDTIDKEYGSVLTTTNNWNKIKKDWRYLQSVNLNINNPQKNFLYHTQIINELFKQIQHISGVSNLILDSEIKTYYLMNSVTRRVPRTVDVMGTARGLGIGIAAKRMITYLERKELIRLSGLIGYNFNDMLDGVKIAIDGQIDPYIKKSSVTTNYFLKVLDSEFIDSSIIVIQPLQYYDIATVAIFNVYNIFDKEVYILNDLLHSRIKRLKLERLLLFLTSLTALLFTSYLYIGFYLSSILAISNLEQVSKQISNGNFKIRPSVQTKDELGSLAESINLMSDNLNTLFEDEKFLRNIIIDSISTLSLKDILHNIVTKTGQYFAADRCFIAEYDDDKQEYLPVKDYASYMSSADIRNVSGYKITNELANFDASIFKTKDVIIVENVDKLDIVDELKRVYKDEFGVKSFMAAPVVYRDELLGILIIAYVKESRKLSQQEINFLSAIAGQSAILIHQAELFNKIQESRKRENLLKIITEAIRSSLDINETLKTICDETAKLFNADRAIIIEFPNKGDYQKWITRREYLISDQVKSFKEVNFDLRVGNFLGENVLNKGKSLAIDDIFKSNCPEYIKDSYREIGISSAIFTPIQKENNKWGLLGLSAINPRVWTKEDIELLNSIAGQTYLAINQAEFYSITKRDAERANAIRKIIEATGGSLDLNEVLTSIFREIIDLFKVDRVVAGTYKRPDDYSEWVATWDVKAKAEYPDFTGDPRVWNQTRQWLGENMVGKAQDIIIDEMNALSVPDFYQEEHKSLWTKSILNVPIKKGNEVWGVLGICQIEYYRHWTESEIDLLHQIADQAFIAVRQAELYSNAKQFAEREALLRAINNEILTSADINDAIQNMVNEIGKLFSVDRVVLRTFDSVQRSFSPVVAEYRKQESTLTALGMPAYPKDVDEFLAQKVIDSKELFIIKDINDPQYPEYFKVTFGKLGVKATAISPIVYKDNAIGVVFLTCIETVKEWTDSEINLLRTVMQQLSIGIHLFTLTDNLTKALNRERNLRDYIFETRQLNNHDGIFNHLLEYLTNVFNTERAVHIHIGQSQNLFVSNEYSKNADMESLLDKLVLTKEHIDELKKEELGEVIVY